MTTTLVDCRSIIIGGRLVNDQCMRGAVRRSLRLRCARSVMSLEGSVTFCVVCGRFDRELVQRRSGLKCIDCVGHRSKRDYSQLQHQQATFMLLSMRGTRSLPVTLPDDGHLYVPDAGSPAQRLRSPRSPRSPRSAAAASADAPPRPTSGRTEPQAARIAVDLDEIIVTVEDPQTVTLDEARVVIPFVKTSIHTQQTYTVYSFVTRRKHCPHETVTRTVNDRPYSLMCDECSKPAAVRHHRFSHALRVFHSLKATAKDGLPALPEKKLFARFSGDFIEQRRRAMEDFLQATVCNSFFVRHPQLLEFLGVEEERAVRIEQFADEANEQELGNEILSEWKRGTLIGRGAYGSVYLGLLPITSQLLAVKVIRVLSIAQSSLSALRAELEMLRTLHHDNIVRLLGVLWPTEKRPEMCIFTEYVECGSVARMVRKFGALPMPVIQRYLVQVVRGLAYLHGRMVVHRDIKGDNILVGKDGSVKLADFGCSAHLEQVAQRDEGIAGTPLWMSPEAMRGEPLAPSTDIWSLGCLGIEMLNRRPWKISSGENVYTAMFRFQKGDGVPDGFPDDTVACPDSFRDLLRKCLQRDASQRPTAEVLLKHPFFADDLTGPPDDGDQEPDTMISPRTLSPADEAGEVL